MVRMYTRPVDQEKTENKPGAYPMTLLSPNQQPPISPLRSIQDPLTSNDSQTMPWNGRFPSSSFTYAPSERDIEIGRVLVESVRIPTEDGQMKKALYNGKIPLPYLMRA